MDWIELAQDRDDEFGNERSDSLKWGEFVD
jgi:hypothetical protein